jgi:tetratricopeptide (TPR) repeat protein
LNSFDDSDEKNVRHIPSRKKFMEISSANLFSALTQQPARMDALAKGALSNGIRLYQDGDYNGAASEFRRAIALSPASEDAVSAYDYLATAFLQLGKTPEALGAYQSALRLAPGREDLHVKFGNILLEEKKYTEALKEYKAALQLNPTSTANLYSLGQAYLAMGDLSGAKAVFNQITDLAPGNYGGYYGLGQTYYREGEYEKAVEQFQNVISIDEQFSYVYLDLGYAYADLGRVDDANAQVKILEEKDPSMAATLSRYIYRVAPPEFLLAYSDSGFGFTLGPRTPLSAMDPSLATPDASVQLSMKFIFNKKMENASVENPFHWMISRASWGSNGGAYNYGLPVPQTEVTLPAFPTRITYDPQNLKAEVFFTVTQNSSANGTLDPSHIIFRFYGQDAYGNSMNLSRDEFGGISKII